MTLARYAAVDDVGHMINPLLVEGQLHGGVAMGVGQALMEHMVYDSSGQVVSGSFMDYCMPRAKDFCDFVLGENEVPTKTNPLGVKGAGESGTVGALASLMNAINDAHGAYRRRLRADAGDAGEGCGARSRRQKRPDDACALVIRRCHRPLARGMTRHAWATLPPTQVGLARLAHY